MKFAKIIYTLLLTFLILAVFAALATAHRKVDEGREFSYVENSEIGPSHWGEIRPEWRACDSGRMQSPIDLLHQRVKQVSCLGRLNRNYKPANATLINREHAIMLRWRNDAGHIKINGTLFHLRQCHWHSPSEHTLDGEKFDMEIHLVHESDDKRTVVIGIMYTIGHPDSFLSVLKNDFEALAVTRELNKDIGIIDPNFIKFGTRKYYRYIGSLTTPPCTQNIIWTIVRKVRTVTREQVQLIRKAVHDSSEVNARPIQPIYGRSIELYRPNDRDN